MADPTLFQRSAEPLAARMRPTTLDEFLGQEHLLGPGKPLGELIRRGEIGSCIFWGPPGSGQTTLARIIARYTDRHFEPCSAVTEGVGRVRELIKQAAEWLQYEGRGTILFCDEIHHFNKAQQDAFLPWVENGTITLIGATTENPSFELRGALLSRCRVFVLEPLQDEHIRTVIAQALEHGGIGRGALGVELSDDAVAALVQYAEGDARRVLNALEAVRQADPRARTVALAAKDAYHFLGSPEGELALAEATVYLATAPKSNRVYEAFGRATDAAAEHPTAAVPLHIRNAPTKLMEEL